MLKRLLPFVPLIFFIACVPSSGEITPPEITAMIQTLTATMWTPTPITPSATPEPNTGRVVEILNNAMLGSNPLAETIEAKFTVIDAQVLMDGPTNQAGILSIHVECEWIYTDSCTPEETFVTLMQALTANDKILGKILEQIPATIHTLQLIAFDHMTQSGIVISNWNDVLDYATGKINGNQLGSRIIRLSTAP